MPLLTAVLFGGLGGIALPQDPIPVRVVNPDVDPPALPPPPPPAVLNPPPPTIPPWPYRKICRLTNGVIFAVAVEMFAIAAMPNGFFGQALVLFAAGAVGSNAVAGVAQLLKRG